MAASCFVQVTDEEIDCFIENAYFSNNHPCSYTKTSIYLKFGKYRWIKTKTSSRFLFINIHLAFGE